MFTYLFERDVSTNFARLVLFSMIAILPFIGGCSEDDNPIVEPDHTDEPFHADADGFLLEIDGKQVYRQFQGEHEGGITLSVGDEVDVLVTFLNPDEEEFHPGEDEDDDHEHEEGGEEEVYGLGLSGYDESIIDIHLSEEHDEDHDDEDHDDEDHDDESKWTFEVIGLSAGETEIKLQLLHGDHPDFTAALMIPVTVE